MQKLWWQYILKNSLSAVWVCST